MSTQGNAWKSSCKQTITAKALAGAETWHATQTGSCSRPPKSPKNSKWKRQMVSDEDSDSSNESLHEHQHTSKKKKNASFKHSWKEKSTTVEIKEVCNIENVTDSEVEVINCKSDAKSGEETENDDGDAETATNHHSRLGAEHFEQLQMLKSSWCKTLANSAQANSGIVKEVLLDEYKYFLLVDEGIVQWENETGEVKTIL
ncbi:hypothetical protein BD769DRAFT_1669215 [Suillus cothurnatus]|nr:hypothetical protein BD769DRAFT_1669215 [Suillus cothurnatus]